MGTPKELVKPYTSKGLQLKLDPSLIDSSSYQELTNLVSNIEGTVAVRLGALELKAFNAGSFGAGVFAVIHSITRLNAGFFSSAITYIGIADQLLYSSSPLSTGGTMSFVQIATGCCSTSATIANQRFADVDFPMVGFTYKFFACPSKMLKSYGATFAFAPSAWRWGIIPPLYPAIASNTGSGSGPPAFTGAETPYLYEYTYENLVTLTESNPGVPMVTSLGITPNGHPIQVQVADSADSLMMPDYIINIYRSGGSFSDGLYRKVGFVAPSTGPFLDAALDQNITNADILQFDNDPPVTAGIPGGYAATVASYASGTGAAGAVSQLVLTPIYGPPITPDQFATPGTIFTIEPGTANEETCEVISSTAGSVTVYFQLSHTVPYTVNCQAQTGAPCSIALSAFNSVFLAGDPFNPQMLYKSKNNQPESFGVIEFSTGISDAIFVSTPSDPIMALVEYGGTLIVMNYETIYYVSVINAQMQVPIKTPAKRGLITKKAYVKVSNEIWYLSYDGIYSFAGGEEQWRSEDIDPLFKGIAVGQYSPINMTAGLSTTGLDVIEMIFADNEIRMNYTDTLGKHNVLRYHTKLHRWSIDTYNSVGGNASIFSLYSEAGNGNTFMGINRQPAQPDATKVQLWLGEQGTTDGWLNVATDGTPIGFAVNGSAVDLAPATDKLFSDLMLECQNPSNNITISAYYDWSSTVSSDSWVIAAGGTSVGRTRYPFSIMTSSGQLGYAMSLRAIGTTSTACELYSLTVHYWELAVYTRGFAMDFSDEGYADDKVLRWLDLEVDTGGVTAQLIIQIDSETTAYSTTINTTYQNRNITVSMPSNLIGRMVRFLIIPGAGGKANLYKYSWNYAKEPASLTMFDSEELVIGSFNGYSFLKQCWIEYSCSSQLTMTFYSDGDTQFYQVILPSHSIRFVERFYFPAFIGSVLNKSKTHKFTLQANTGFKLYADGSRLEWLACGADQRGAYQQMTFSQVVQPLIISSNS